MIISKINYMFFTISLLCFFPNCLKTTHEPFLQEKNNNDTNNFMIKLFIYPSCPYCKKVLNYLRENNWIEKVQIINASIPQNLTELKKINNNNTQCPFIYNPQTNLKMLESDDIINYFSMHFTTK